MGKAYGTKWGAIGNMFENTLGAWVTYWELNWELDGNTLGPKNLNTPLPFTRGKKMNILGVCCNSSLVEQNYYLCNGRVMN